MKHSFRSALFAVTLLAVAAPAHAAVVKYGGTGSLGAGNITFEGGGATTDWDSSRPGVWTDAVTDPASDWVHLDGTAGTFVFEFDLSGYDLSTASVQVDWSADNIGVAYLNGNDVTGEYTDYTAISSFTLDDDALFASGANLMRFVVTGDGRTDGFRAAIAVTADLAAVPLPASLPLLLGGLVLVGARRRKSRAAA
ncbi:PEP-CTERM domain protein [Puniceibacterium sp. IMCC21224]|uniref:PEP-CTERM domain protein n=1 Tax=Puniceibacterium sp. IMCC21224 TaxID=1618204 RepID=UPI00064DD692|nr:PEP-CTERM domain protein [Puniceibacterium sp. IMCC21224]KMK68713.1 PEP-CTERM motif [Puniceibacterium sp. IMCC21224]